jgi:hypothetical protein
MLAKIELENGYFVLSAWCAQAKRWIDLEPRFSTPGDAERCVMERGVYRAVFLRERERDPCERFAWIGENDYCYASESRAAAGLPPRLRRAGNYRIRFLATRANTVIFGTSSRCFAISGKAGKS